LVRAGKILYLIWSLAVILAAYILPYTLFASVTNLSLYVFWAAVAVIHLLISYAYIRVGDDYE